MASELSPDKDAVVDLLVATGFFSDRRQALDHAVELLREEAESAGAVREALAPMVAARESRFDEAVRTLRAKHRIPDDA